MTEAEKLCAAWDGVHPETMQADRQAICRFLTEPPDAITLLGRAAAILEQHGDSEPLRLICDAQDRLLRAREGKA